MSEYPREAYANVERRVGVAEGKSAETKRGAATGVDRKAARATSRARGTMAMERAESRTLT